MDNIWIFLIIIGAVISMAQKNQQKNRPVEQDGDAHESDPQAEWERRIKELFGETEEQDTTKAPESVAPQKPAVPTVKATSKTSLSPNHHSSSAASVKAKVATVTSKANSAAAGQNKRYGNPIKDGDITAGKSEINDILDGFSMEKAVVYSEILRPKFEE